MWIVGCLQGDDAALKSQDVMPPPEERCSKRMVSFANM